MKRVKISDLKAHLSQYLREVQDGETIMVCDRDRAIAQISSPNETLVWPDGFSVEGDKGPLPSFEEMRPVKLDGPVDVVAILRESRDKR